jgi:hypothetical protein
MYSLAILSYDSTAYAAVHREKSTEETLRNKALYQLHSELLKKHQQYLAHQETLFDEQQQQKKKNAESEREKERMSPNLRLPSPYVVRRELNVKDMTTRQYQLYLELLSTLPTRIQNRIFKDSNLTLPSPSTAVALVNQNKNEEKEKRKTPEKTFEVGKGTKSINEQKALAAAEEKGEIPRIFPVVTLDQDFEDALLDQLCETFSCLRIHIDINPSFQGLRYGSSYKPIYAISIRNELKCFLDIKGSRFQRLWQEIRESEEDEEATELDETKSSERYEADESDSDDGEERESLESDIAEDEEETFAGSGRSSLILQEPSSFKIEKRKIQLKRYFYSCYYPKVPYLTINRHHARHRPEAVMSQIKAAIRSTYDDETFLNLSRKREMVRKNARGDVREKGKTKPGKLSPRRMMQRMSSRYVSQKQIVE